MSWDVRVLTAPSLDTELCLLVTFDNAKYLINCGEGTQRNFVQKKISLRKLDGVFLTNGSAACIGGLPGVMMTLADGGSGSNTLKVAGPESVPQYLASCRTFVQRESLPLSILDIPASPERPVYQTNQLSVRAITLRPDGQNQSKAIGADADEESNFEWKDTPRQLKNLTTPQLRWWRRAILKGIFKDPNPAASAALASKPPVAEAGVAPESPAAIQTEEELNAVGTAEELAAVPMTVDEPTELSAPADRSQLDAIPVVDEKTSVVSEAVTPDVSAQTPDVPNRWRGVQQLSRSYIPQPIPLEGSDSQTTSQPHLLEDIRIAYILQAPMIRGKFDSQKAKLLGVPNGPIRGKLTAGQAIEIDDPKNPGQKKTIKPADVVGAPQDGGAAIIIDVDVGHVTSLVESPVLREYQMGGDKHANLVVHRVTAAVTRDSRYVEWASKFDEKTEQVVSIIDEIDDAITYTSSAWNLLRLNMLDKDIFKPQVVEKLEKERSSAFERAKPVQAYQTIKMYPPAPLRVLTHSGADPNYPESAAGQEASQQGVLEQMPRYADALRTLESASAPALELQPEDYGITVTPFGTGSAIPSKYRNVSSTLLEIPGLGGVLLDAGEGTLGQMRRRFGTAGMAEQIYPNLKMIFISHMHADHHLGLRLVLEDRLKHNPQQLLYIVAPSYILLHLVENGMRIGDPFGKTRFVDIIAYEEWIKRGSPALRDRPPAWQKPGRQSSPSRSEASRDYMFYTPHYSHRRELAMQTVKALQADLGLTSFLTPEVNHRGKAYGLVMQHETGWKISYSGDTMPCERLIETGRDSTLLIHEATLEDTAVDMALAKGHSTFGQAIEVGSKMNAKYLLLNHFSQRYPKLPRIQPFDPTSENKRPIIALAFDLMSLPLKAFPAMETYNDALEALFEEMAEAEPESDAEEEAEQISSKKPADKKNGKQPKAVKNKSSRPPLYTAAEAMEVEEKLSIRQRKRLERQEALQAERASASGTATEEAENSVPSAAALNGGGKRRLSNAAKDGGSPKRGLKRSKSDADDKLSKALDNMNPL